MAKMPPPPPPPPPAPPSPTGDDKSQRELRGPKVPEQGRTRLLVTALLLGVLLFVVVPSLVPRPPTEELTFNQLKTEVIEGNVNGAEFDNTTGEFTGTLKGVNGEADMNFTAKGPLQLSDEDQILFDTNIRDENGDFSFVYDTPRASIWASLLPFFFIIGLMMLFVFFMQRRAQGQMGGIMSIGKSKAKAYSSERPGTTFEDVAGYEGVKQEVTEVIDFLKHPEKFSSIGARIPKGILLVGPPGTGKTLIARAVAGEAGVPFLSVTGSDFMEMFVGVGASRVRDLFQSARKMGRAIIFIDEIDSIGRKRGAGMGGGHDEREQTLNQMLSEMDGFEATEGIVMMAATNRPDILDPALLRPGRFDRQITVPFPELEDRKAILEVHVRGKKMSDEVDLALVARGAPGMSGADLANLVNEAALFAVREGASEVKPIHFENARDRVLMGAKRDSMVLSDEEKEAIAYHEGGHAICAAVLPTADPLHKVTIIPSGMALGVTMQLPDRERHIYRQDYIEDRLVLTMGGRIAEEIVYGVASTGANNDLTVATDLARKMVREWGMSGRIGPMAWSGGGEMFLGDQLVSSSDYSDETARVIDEEVERILRASEARCRDILNEHRGGLDLIARSLLEHETIDGDEVARLIGMSNSGGATTQFTAPSTGFLAPGALALPSSEGLPSTAEGLQDAARMSSTEDIDTV